MELLDDELEELLLELELLEDEELEELLDDDEELELEDEDEELELLDEELELLDDELLELDDELLDDELLDDVLLESPPGAIIARLRGAKASVTGEVVGAESPCRVVSTAVIVAGSQPEGMRTTAPPGRTISITGAVDIGEVG